MKVDLPIICQGTMVMPYQSNNLTGIPKCHEVFKKNGGL